LEDFWWPEKKNPRTKLLGKVLQDIIFQGKSSERIKMSFGKKCPQE